MADFDAAVAGPGERATLDNLMQLYVHDFSEHWAGTSKGELASDGRFEPYPLDAYWRDAGHVPLLLRLGGNLIGFALLNASSHSGLPVDRNMAEFFIVREYRRDGVGTVAATAIFSGYPGQWEAAVARKNVGALAFWRNVVRRHPRVEDVEETDHSSAAWNGPILRFKIRPPTG